MNTFLYSEIKKKIMYLLILTVIPCLGFSQELAEQQPQAPVPMDMPQQLSAKVTAGPPPPPGPINDMILPSFLLSVAYVGYFFMKKQKTV